MTPALYINSAGMVEAVDPARAGEVEALGWVPASAAQAKDYFLREKYGTTGQAAIAGLESLGSMLTLGASTHLETGLGVDPEAIAAREKFNPLASGTGSTIGILAPLLMTGGASGAVQGAEAGSAAARAAAMTGPSLLASAGKAAAKAALRELPETAPLAQRLAAKGLAAAAGGALEGAGYEVGQLVHESALGDPNLTAESALARVGLSAATFGALSGGGSLLGQLAGEAVSKFTSGDAKSMLSDWLRDVEIRSNAKAAGAIQSNLAAALKRSGEGRLDSILLEMRDMGILRNALDTPAAVLERAKEIQSKSAVSELLRSMDEAARPTGELLGDLPAAVQKARTEVLAPLAANPTEKGAARAFEELLNDYEAKGATTLTDMHEVRRQLSKIFDVGDPNRTALSMAYHDFRSIVSEEMGRGIEKMGGPMDVWKVANREYEVASTAANFARAGIKRRVGNLPLGIMEGLGGLAGTVGGGPLGGAIGAVATGVAKRQGSATLGWMARGLRDVLEREGGALADRTAEAVAAERMYSQSAHASGLAAAFAPGPEAISFPAGLTILERASTAPETAAALSVLAQAQRKVTEEVDSALMSLIKNAPGAVGRAGAANLSRRAADAVEVRRLASSPELLQDVLARQTDELHHHAPSIAQATQMASARVLALLAAKAPSTHLPGTHARAVRPPASELAKFGRFADVALRPLNALEHARRGTLTTDHVAALRLGWPATYQHIQERFLDALMASGGSIRHPQSRMMASMLTGFRLDASMEWNAIAANQAVFARAAQPMPGGTVPNPDAAALKGAGRMRTPTQRADARMEGD